MHRNQMASGIEGYSGREPRQIVAILGIITTGLVSALSLPLWMAAPLLLLALGAIRVIATAEPVMEPVVIRREEYR